MRISRSFFIASTALLTFSILIPATPAKAQMPAYLHAISDLRTARAFLQRDNRQQFAGAEAKAITEMSAAIDDMSKAAADDGKNPWQAPPPDPGANPNTPIHSAIRLLEEAHQDISRGQDSPENFGLQVRALKHIDAARRALVPLL